MRAHIVGKVRFKEHPTFANLGTRHKTSFGSAAEFFGAQFEEFGCLDKVKRLHRPHPLHLGICHWPNNNSNHFDCLDASMPRCK